MADRITPPSISEPAGALEFKARDLVRPGERVRVEISFGPMADEVELDGVVDRVRELEQGRSIRFRVEASQVARMDYVNDVAKGLRQASARRHRRFPADQKIRWASEGSTHHTRLMDVSQGGAFIRSEALPDVGEEVVVQLELGDASLVELRSKVAWTSRNLGRSGFGVSFKFGSRDEAAHVQDFVRAAERAARVA